VGVVEVLVDAGAFGDDAEMSRRADDAAILEHLHDAKEVLVFAGDEFAVAEVAVFGMGVVEAEAEGFGDGLGDLGAFFGGGDEEMFSGVPGNGVGLVGRVGPVPLA